MWWIKKRPSAGGSLRKLVGNKAGFPFQERAHDPHPSTVKVPSSRVSGSRIIYSKAHDPGRMGMHTKRILGHQERRDGHEACGEKSPWNASYGHISTDGARGPLPFGVSIMCGKNNDVLFVMQIEDRHENMPRLHHVKFHDKVDRPSDIESIHDDPGLSLNPHGPHPHHL